MATLSELRARILRLLDDPEGAGYSDDLLLNAISAALDAILPWAPKTSISSITGDGTTKAFPLPTDLYEIEALVDESTGEVLPRSVLAPGLLLGVNSRNNNDWLEYPSGSISFAGTGYRVGNRYLGQVVGVRLVGDTVQITQDGHLLRTHRVRHDKGKEFGALANPGGRPRRSAQDVA